MQKSGVVKILDLVIIAGMLIFASCSSSSSTNPAEGCCTTNADCPTGHYCETRVLCGACLPDGSGANTGGDLDEAAVDGDPAFDAEETGTTADGDTQADMEEISESDGDSDGENQTEQPGEDETAPEGEATEAEAADPGIDGYLIVVVNNSSTTGYTGNEFSLCLLDESGEFNWYENRVRTHDRIADAVFTPGGGRLIVTHEGGEISIFDIKEAVPELRFDITTDSYPEEILAPDSTRAYILDGNPQAYGGGLKILNLAANPPAIETSFVALHAPSGLALRPGGGWAAAFGGRTLEDTDNTASIDLRQAAPSVYKFYDFWDERASVYDPGFSPDGTLLAAGNNSPFYADANTVKLFSFGDDGEMAVLDETTVDTPSAFVFTEDGKYLLVSSFEKGLVSIFEADQGVLIQKGVITGLPLADDIVPLRAGPLAGRVIIATYQGLYLYTIADDGVPTQDASTQIPFDGAAGLIGGITVGHSYQ